ncbi:hypothetical protein [Ketobacter alkanivorans]|uniref:Permease n=1 Tax=Ketobacter alkanivorans TaxID=1917421 RepID=A0A2K9LJC0_9GAMM|nr:hypothetical protein [Ketobacter alkanivorans]AUM12459.1 hypothetical protein Kalk_08510 [Ketobacter alkanivorans]MCP5019312.1 hypothetical protein [Ketobacter sp.]
MGELRFKSHWNGMLTTSMVMLAALVLLMGFQISRMATGAGADITAPASLVFIGLFVGALASLVGLKANPKGFALLGVLICAGIVLHLLISSGLFAVESLVASIALVFLLLGMVRLGRE